MNMFDIITKLANIADTAPTNESMSVESAGSVDTDAVMYLLKRFEQDMNEIGGYGDIDVNTVMSLLQSGNAEEAAIEASSSFADQDGGEIYSIEKYARELEGEFNHLLSGNNSTNEPRGESMGSQGDVGGAHGEETISPVHGENMDHDLTMESLRYLSGVNKTITECGIPTAMVGGSHTPASINITASSGPELTGMLKDIMSLAGVRDTPKTIDVLSSPSPVDHTPSQGPNMAALIRAVDEPEADSDSMNDEPENEGMPEKTENRPWDSSPHEKERQDGVRKFGDANSGDHRERQAGLPRAKPTTEAIAAQLFADYKKFVSEAASDEPAAPDADAIAKRKRLQAIKDRQEDNAAEKAYKKDSNVRVHHAKYDNDVDEASCDVKKPRNK